MKHLIILLLLSAHSLFAQNTKEVMLASLGQQSKLEVINREVIIVTGNKESHIQISEGKGEGLVWLKDSNFKKGKIVIRMRGKDVLQRSFIGIAFHAQNDSTFEAVYCRPFNFLAKDSVRRIHAIQYISHPIYTWKKLREEQNGIFEKEIMNPPNPNDWFIMTLIVDKKTVKAYIDDKKAPSLVIKRKGKFQHGKLGVFVGDGAGGDFESISY